MILKTYPNPNKYGKYFLAVEAPEDEEVTDPPKRNMKIIQVKPDNNRRTDFTQYANEPEEEPVEDPDVGDDTDFTDTGEEAPAEESPDAPDTGADDADFTPDDGTGEDPDTAPAEDTTGDEGPDTGDDTDFTATDDAGGDAPAEGGGEETGEDGPDMGDDTDFTDAGDDGTGEEGGDTTTDDGTGGDNKQPGVELDSTRKYNLFKEFMSLYNACDNYISKLENVIKDDEELNQVIKIAVNSLREIKDILYDYMTIRFKLNTYIQSLLFYQKMVVSVQLVFSLLKSKRFNKDEEDKKKKKSTKSSKTNNNRDNKTLL